MSGPIPYEYLNRPCEVIESLIDRWGLLHCLVAIECVCSEQAALAESGVTSIPAPVLAQWRRDAKRISAILPKIENT